MPWREWQKELKSSLKGMHFTIIEALFTPIKMWQQPKCPWVDEHMKNIWFDHPPLPKSKTALHSIELSDSGPRPLKRGCWVSPSNELRLSLPCGSLLFLVTLMKWKGQSNHAWPAGTQPVTNLEPHGAQEGRKEEGMLTFTIRGGKPGGRYTEGIRKSKP